MKFLLVIAGIVAVIVVAVSFVFLNRTPPHIRSLTPTTQAPAPQNTALVTPIANQVFAQQGDANAQEHFSELTQPTEVSQGSRVKTSETGRALIEGARGTIFFDHDTEMIIALADDMGKTRMELEAGTTWSRIEKLLDRGEFHEIQTKNAYAAVRGTSFGLQFLLGTTTLMVTQGQVVFGARDLLTGELIPDSEVVVGQGEKAIRRGDGQILVEDITDRDRKSEWFRINNSSTVETKPQGGMKSSSELHTPSLSPTSPSSVSTPPPPASPSVNLQERPQETPSSSSLAQPPPPPPPPSPQRYDYYPL